MGIFSQLGSNLWKNFTLQARQPVILCVNVLLPIGLFVLLAVIRQAVPPVSQPTCSYNPRSLPSAGALSYMQSYVCNVNNKCQNVEPQTSKAASASKRIAKLVKNLKPLTQKDSKVGNVLNNMDTSIKLLDDLGEMLQKKEVQQFLNDSFTVSSLVKDPEVIRKYLVETERVMSDLMAKALLDATINMEGLLNLTGNIDFKGIVCNSTRFGKYLLFKDESTQASIADQLCRLNSSKIPEIVDYVQKQIDVAKIMKIIAHMAELGGNYTISKGFNDLADIIALGNQVSDANMPNLNHLAKWIKDVGQFVERSVNVSKTDFAGLGFILQTLDPIIQKFSPDSPTWNETRKIMSLANKLMKWYSQESVRVPTMQLTFGNMFGKSIKLQEFLKKTLQMTTDSIVAMGTATLNLQKFKAVLDVIDNSPDKPVALHRAFCVDPGFVSMWTFTPGTDVQQLRRYQAMICRMNITELVKEFSTELDVDAIMQQVASYQSKPFQGSMNWTDVVFTAKTFIEKLIASADLFKPLFEPLSKISLENLWSQFEKLIFNNGTSDMNRTIEVALASVHNIMQASLRDGSYELNLYKIYSTGDLLLNLTDRILQTETTLNDLFLQNQFRTAMIQLSALSAGDIASIVHRFSQPAVPMRLLQALLDNVQWKTVMCDANELMSYAIKQVVCSIDWNAVQRKVVTKADIPGLQLEFAKYIEMMRSTDISLLVDVNPYLVYKKFERVWRGCGMVYESTQLIPKSVLASFKAINPAKWSELKNMMHFPDTHDSFGRSILFAMLETLGPVLSNSTAWNDIGPVVWSVTAFMNLTKAYVTTEAKLVTNMKNMVGYTIKYGPDVLKAFAETMMIPEKTKKLMTVRDWPKMLCSEKEFRSYFTLPQNVPVAYMQNMLCSLNLDFLKTYFVNNYQNAYVDWDYTKKLMITYMTTPAGVNPAYNWTDMIRMSELVYSSVKNLPDMMMITPDDMKRYDVVFQQMKMMAGNFNVQSLSSLSPMMAEIMVMIDQQMKGSPQYAAVVSWMTLDYIINKHILNVVDKISVNGLRLKDLFTNSIAVRSVLTRALSLTPELIDILLDSIVHPHKLVAVLLKIELNSTKSICDGTISVTSFLTFKEPMIVGMLEKSICDNWQRIVSELKNEPIVKEVDDWLKNQKNTSWIDSKMNITDYFYDYIAISEKVMNLNLMNKPIFPESQINTTHIMTSVQAFAKEMSAYDWKKLETDLTKIADTMNNSPNLFSTETNSIISLASTVHKLINKQLNVLNKAQVYSYELMGSSELNKIMNVVATMGPDVISVAGYSVLSWLQDPAKVVQIASLQQPLTLCTDAALFQKIFTASPYRPVNLVDLQQKLCRLMATVNITLLAEQLVDYGGFQKQIQQAMTSTSKVNFTNIVTEALSTKNLVENLINNPPNVMSLPAQLQDSQEWLKVVNTLKLSYDKILDILQSVNWMSILLEPKVTQMLQEQINNLKLNSVFNEMNKILPAINDQLKQIIGKNLPFNRWFARYPQLFKVVSSMDQLPSAIAVIIASDQRPDLMNALFSKVNTTNFPLMICNPSVISQYLVVPMRARSDFYVFMQKLCSLNVTELYMELASTVGLNPYKLMPSENPVDVFKLMKNIISMQQIIQNITMSPPQSSLPMWLDPKSWDIVLIQMHERAMQSPNATDVFIRHIMLMYASYFDRVVKAYDLGAFVNLETVLFKRINAYLKSLLTLDSPSPDSLELMKVAGLIKYMPVIMHTVLRTSLYKSSEITKSILDKTILQKLCGPDPSSVLSIPMNVDIKPALKIICQLNFTKITDDFDYNSLLSPLLNNNATSTNQANVTELIATVFEYTNLLTAINQRLAAGTLWKMPIWMEPRQMQTLAAVMWGELEKYSSNAQKNIMNSLNNPALIQALSDAKEVQPILNAMNAAIPTAVQRIDSLAGNLSLTAFFADFPQTSRIMRLMNRLQTMAKVALHTLMYKNSMISVLVGKTDPIKELCMNPRMYLEISQDIGTVLFMSQVQAVLCSMNVTELTHELQQFYSQDKVMQAFKANTTANVTELMYNVQLLSEAISKLMKTGTNWPPNLNPWLDATKWVNLYNDMVLQFMGSPNTPVYDRVMNLIRKSLAPSIDPIINYMNGTEGIKSIQALVKLMLEYTKPGGNMRLVNIIKGIPRLRALWDILMKLPQYSEVLMQTMLDPVKAEKLLRMLSTNWKELCLTADLNTVFVIPTMSNVDMTQLQQTLCTMNVSLLLQDLNEMNLQHMGSLESLVSGQPMPPFNTTAVVQMAWKLYQAFPKNSSMLMESYFHFNLTSMPLIDVTNWQRVLDSVTKYAINKFGALNETAGVLKLLNDLNPLIINAVNESAPALAMYNKVMAVLKNMMSLFEKYVVYLTDPSAGLKILAGASNSEVLKLQSALYNAPDIFGLLLNAVINPEKSVPILFNVLSGNPDVKSAVCASNIDWKQYFPVPAAGKINGAQLKKILCSLNITLLGEQFAAPEIIQTMTLLENPAANPGTTSLTTIASTVTNLMKVSEKLAYFSDNATKVFPYSDPAKWKMVIDNFMQKVTILGSNPQAQVQKIMATISAITPLLNQGIKPPTSGIFKAITVILDMLVTKLESVNQTDISVTEFFAKSPQTQSMIRFLQNRFPVVFETLLLSADTKRFEKLRNMTNATEALITVCHPFLDINNYIVAPKGVNLTELKTEFCSVDFMKLQAELMNEFEVGKIQAELVSTTPMQWIQLAQVLMRANVQITKWTKLPPKVVTHPWMNSSLWIDIFTRFGNERNDTQSIFKQIVQTYSALIPLLDNSTHAKSAAFVLDKLLTAFIGQVSGLLMPGATYTLENLTANLPQLRNIVNIALNESPTIIDALMKAPFRNPAVLMKLLTSKNWRADLCSGGLVAALNVGPEVNATRIEELFCKINETKMSEELMLAYGFDRVLAAVMQILMPNFSPKIDWLRLLAKSKKFLDLLMAVIANPPKFIPPNLTADRYQRVIDNFMKTVNLQDLKTFYPLIKVFDGLLKNTTLYESMAPMYAAMTYVLDFTNTVLGMTKVTNQTLDIGGLFTNMQKIRAMMTTVAKMHPQLLDNLMAVSFKLDKVVPLVLMTVSLKSVVCNESLIDEYMFYPPAITASDIKSAFCNISDPALSAEIEKQFNIKNLVAKVKAASQGLTKFDLLKFVEAEWKLYTNIQALATITGVAFNGKPLEFKFNSSLPITLTMYIQNLPRLSIPTFAAIMEEFMPVIENTEFWRVVRPHLELVNVVVKIINQKMTDINPQNITLGSILKSAGYTKMTIQNAFKMSPDIVNMLFTVSVDPTKALREAVSNPSRPWPETLKAMFCDPKNSILSTADQTTVKSTLCSVNGMMMMVELTRAFSVDKMLQQIAAITSNATYTKQFNWTEYLLNVQELEKNSFNLAARIRTPNLVDFFAYSGNISAWLERLQKAGLMPQLSADQIIQLLVSSLDHFTPYLNHNTTWGRTALAVLKSVQFTTSLIKDKLKSITSANPITLDDLFKNTTQLKDIMKTVFGLSVPQIQSLLTAKIDFIKLMSLLRVPDPVAAFCTVNIAALIRPSGVSVDLPKFQKKLCNLNSTLLVDELAKSYNVEAIKIHWEKAIAAQLDPVRIDWNQSLIQYARLTAIVQSIVLNPPKIDPTITNAFDVNKTILPVLNTIQQTLTKYFNLNPNDPNSFTTMLQAFGAPIVALQNVPEAKPLFTALAVVKTTVDYVNEMTSKLTVNLVDKTVELSSIVKNVTKIQQILRLTMNLGPDFVNGFLATQWKLNMVIPFISTQSMLQTNTQLIERIFCNETLMANVIHFSPGFDTKLMKDAFCTWNNTEILAQLQQQFDIARITQQVQLALGTSQVDFGRFLQSVQKLQANILSLMGLKGVKLMGKDVVKYFNMSVVVNVPMIPFIQQLPKAEAVVFGNYLQQLDAAFLRVQFWAQIRQSLNLVVMIADVLYNRTNAIHSSGLSLGSVFGNSPIVNKFLAETYRLTPDMVKIVMSASMQPATTLKLAVNNGNFVQLICGNEIMLPKSANENEIRRLLCTTNFTSLSLELRKLIKFDVILKQIKALNQPSMKPLNWTRAIESVQRLYTSYSQLLRAIRLPTMSEFFKQTGTTDAKWTNNVLNALKMIPVRVEDIPLLVSEGIRVALYGLQNVPGTRPLLEMIYKYGQLYQGIVKMLIKQLTPFQTKVTLDMLVRNITEIKRFIQGNILMSPAELDAVFSMNVDVGKLSILMTNPNPCAVDWNSILIIPAGKSQKPLTKIQMTACMNATLIYEKLKSEFNIQAYIHLLQQPPTGRLNWTQVVLDSAHLVDLIMKMLKKPPTVGDQLLNMADYTRYQTAIQTLLQRFNRSFTTQDMLMFGQALDELSAVLKRSPQGRAALQALDVVDFYLKFINTRLEQALKEPITLKLMLKSATIMRDYLTSVARFDARAATVLLNSEISPLFLYNLMNDFKNGALNESTLKDRLCSTPLHSWLKLPANQMQQKITIEELHKQICRLATPAFMQQLENEFEIRNAMQIHRMGPNGNFTSMLMNQQQLQHLITKMIQSSPSIGKSLKMLFNTTNWLETLQELTKMDPKRLLSLMASIGSAYENIDPSFKEIMLQVSSVLDSMKISKYFLEKAGSPSRIENLLSNNTAIKELVDTLFAQLSPDSIALSDYNKAFYRVSATVIAKEKSMQDIICKPDTLESYLSATLYMNVTAMSAAICGIPGENWSSALKSAGFNTGEYIFLVQLLSFKFLIQNGSSIDGIVKRLLPPNDWAKMKSNLLSIVDVFTALNKLPSGVKWQLDLEKYLPVMSHISELIQKKFWDLAVLYLNYVDPFLRRENFWNEMKKNIAIQANVYEQFNKILKSLGPHTKISLSRILPNSTALANILKPYLSPSDTASLLTAVVNPERFSQFLMANEKAAVNMMCNAVFFQETFLFGDNSVISADAIQTAMCNALKSDSLRFGKIVKLIRMTDFVNAVTAAITKPADLTRNPFVYYVTEFQKWMTSFAQVMNSTGIDTVDLANWFKPIEIALNATKTMNNESINAACQATVKMLSPQMVEMIANLTDGTLTIYEIFAEKMNIIEPNIADVICSLKNLNISGLLELVNKLKIQETVKRFENLFSKPAHFSCQRTYNVISEYVAAVERFSKSDLFEKVHQCHAGQAQPSILKTIDAAFEMGATVAKLLSDPALKEFLNIMDIEMILRPLLSQKSVTLKMAKLFTSEAKASEILVDALKLAPEVAFSLLGATVTVDLRHLGNKSDEALKDTLCKPENLAKAISFSPLLNVDYKKITDSICTENVTSNIRKFRDAVNIGYVIVRAFESSGLAITDVALISDIVKYAGDIIKRSQSLIDLFAILNDFSTEKALEILPRIQRFIMDNQPDKIFDSIVSLLQTFEEIGKDPSTKRVMNILAKLANGVKSLHVYKTFMPLNVALKDVVKSPEDFADYLVSIGLTKNASEALMMAPFSYLQVLVANNKANINELICNATNLGKILTVSNTPTLSIEDISRHLCSIDRKLIVNITETVLRNLDIGRLIQTAMNMGINGLLRKSNVSAESMKEMMQAMKPMKEHLAEVMYTVANMTNDIPSLDTSTIGSDPPSASGAMKSISRMMCGMENMFSVNDEMNVAGKIGQSAEQKKADNLSDSYLNEVKILKDAKKSEFCIDIFKTIRDLPAGPVIWAFFKPFLMGKVAFTPNTPLTRRIMSSANSTYEELASLIDMLKSVNKNVQYLEKLSDMGPKLDIIKKSMANPMVGAAMMSITGVDGTELIDSLSYMTTVSRNDTARIKQLAGLTLNFTECMDVNRYVGVSSEKELQTVTAKWAKERKLLGGIVFEFGQQQNRKKRAANNTITAGTLPKFVRYKIRVDVDNTMNTDTSWLAFTRPGPGDNFAEDLRYLRGFLPLQDMIDRAIIKEQTGKDVKIPIQTQQFPYPCYMKDSFLSFVYKFLLPLMMIITWITFIGIAIKSLVYDRETGIEEVMKVMGMSSVVNFVSWFITNFLLMMALLLVIVLVMKVSSLLPYSNPLILILLFMDFSFSTLMMCYMVSAFFNRSNLAALVGILFYLMSYQAYIITEALEVKMTFWQQILASLFSTSAFSFSTVHVTRAEDRGVGIQWSNTKDTYVLSLMTFEWGCIMMFVDGLIYFVIGWYVRNIYPGKYGTPRPWYFPLTPSYWNCFCSQKKPTKMENKYGIGQYVNPIYESDEKGACLTKGIRSTEPSTADILELNPLLPFDENEVHEREPREFPIGISIQNLTKRYGKCCRKKKVAVDGLNLNLFEGQVTAFLGHNGAGKTSTINILTGITPPSSGTAFIDGKDVTTRYDSIRKSLGFCPQQNVLYKDMSVKEHLEMFAKIKGNMPRWQQKEDVESMLINTGLYNLQDEKVRNISGGMKRRLSIAIAFIGGSKVVILDEPTAGVDPAARRSIWDIISKYKKNCTVLLSTHHLEEADVLGDRIAIIHRGRLLCSGSSMFLKKRYGQGYHLNISKMDKIQNGKDSVQCSAEAIMNFVGGHVEGAYLLEEVGREIRIILPNKEKAKFQHLFMEMNDNVTNLSIAGYGVSDTLLEEVFMNVCTMADMGKPVHPDNLTQLHGHFTVDKISPDASKVDEKEATAKNIETTVNIQNKVTNEHDTGCLLKMRQFGALLGKRFHHHRRYMWGYLSHILMPLICVTFAIWTATYNINLSKLPARRMLPELYGPNLPAFVKNSNPSVSMNSKLINALVSDPGPSVSCMNNFNRTKEWMYQEYQCLSNTNATFDTPAVDQVMAIKYNKKPSCHCTSDRLKCPAGASGLPVPRVKTKTSTTVYDLTGRNITDWILTTWQKFIYNRYGGWEFGNPKSTAVNDQTATIWFYNRGIHALPGFYNGFTNAMLRANLNVTQNPNDYGILTVNDPLYFNEEQLSQENLKNRAASVGVTVMILVAFCFIPASLAVFIVKERITSEKHLQTLYGVTPMLYWISTFFWDLIIFAIPVALSIAIMRAFNLDIFAAKQNLGGTAAILMLFGWAILPLTYLLSRCYKDGTTAYLTTFMFYLMGGVLLLFTVFILEVFSTNSEVIKAVYGVVGYIVYAFPPYTLCEALIQLGRNQVISSLFERFGQDTYNSPFSAEVMGWHCVALAVEGFVFFVINLLCECDYLCCHAMPKKLPNSDLEDDDVSLERQRVVGKESNNDVISIHELSKIYRSGRQRVLAVDQLTVGIPEKECFGLLGVNGAGKTSTFSMITGAIMPSAGQIFFTGHDVTYKKGAMAQNVGYCPQFDALDLQMTGLEILNFYGTLKGIKSKELKQSVDDIVKVLELQDYLDMVISQYSGGTKRRLSIAVALLGKPTLIMLDEPTAGMDVKMRQLVRNYIVNSRLTVILSSHRMDECEAMCSKLAIMVNGHFQCIGSPQHLRNKFGEGYTLQLRLSTDASPALVAAFIKGRFPGTILKDQHLNFLEFSIPHSTSMLPSIFGHIEREKDKQGIEDYSVSQTTLDQVFFNFSRSQGDGLLSDDSFSDSDDARSSLKDSDIHVQEHRGSGRFVPSSFSNLAYASKDDPLEPKIIGDKQVDAHPAVFDTRL